MDADSSDSILGISRYRSGGNDDSPSLSKVGIVCFSQVHSFVNPTIETEKKGTIERCFYAIREIKLRESVLQELARC